MCVDSNVITFIELQKKKVSFLYDSTSCVTATTPVRKGFIVVNEQNNKNEILYKSN